MENTALATGKVVKAFGNLLHVEFDKSILQGEVAFVKIGEETLACEVIEIAKNVAKVQVFEDTSKIKLDTVVQFTGHLMQAELGPGLLTSIFDGLQNPLEKIAQKAGMFLAKGLYIAPLDHEKKWDFKPKIQIGATVKRGDFLGEVKESLFDHQIMAPFWLKKKVKITYIAGAGSYNIDATIAKAVDENNQEYQFSMVQKWPIKQALIEGERIVPEKDMLTGLRILDTAFPVLKGGTFCSPGPFGAGKTVLQHHLAKHSDVDIVIVAACGERAGEVVEILREFPHLTDARTNTPLMNRTVIICNTSSMPVASREASVYMAVTIAEYYRQMGLDVLVLADSTSRWAQAMREISGRLEEIPGEEAFPAYLASRISAFYERSGVIKIANEKTGSVTIGGAVSPAGGNFEEPVTQATLAVVGTFWGLSRERSDARKYPAIDPLISWTKYLKSASKEFNVSLEGWESKVIRALNLLRQADEIAKRMEVVGEEGVSIDDLIIYLKGELFDNCYLQQNAFDKVDAFCSKERQIELFKIINVIFDKHFIFDVRDEVRSFFLWLQNQLKNLNFNEFKSKEYEEIENSIKTKIDALGT